MSGSRAKYCPVRLWWRRASISLAVLGILAAASGSQAVEVRPAGCDGLCAPLDPAQLDVYRAQGLGTGAADMKLGIILWDEYRRVRPPVDPSEITSPVGAAIPYTTDSRINVIVAH